LDAVVRPRECSVSAEAAANGSFVVRLDADLSKRSTILNNSWRESGIGPPNPTLPEGLMKGDRMRSKWLLPAAALATKHGLT
jgi:hypothetical protein